ncbi:MAG: tetratricopeptide repeat protein [Verrucomicrobiia bacterium]
MSLAGWLLVLGWCFAPLVRAEDRAAQLAAEGYAEFAVAEQAWDGARFSVAADLFRTAAAAAPKTSAYRYWTGVAEFHRMLQLESMPSDAIDRAGVEAAMSAAIAALSEAVKLNDTDAESHALLGTLHGMRIGKSWFRALQLGPRVQRHSKKALEFGAENPRVRYLQGTGQFHTADRPAEHQEALASLLDAEKLYELEAKREPGPLEPRWGRSSCLTFIGRSYERLGQKAEAAESYRRALKLQPGNRMAGNGLARVTATK